MREYMIEQVLEHKAVAIVRGASVEDCLKVADALYAGGIRLMEIIFNQKNPASFADTAKAISAIAERYEGRMLVGAGTVTTPELVEIAANAGARFIISPDTNPAVIKKTRELGLVSMPGALTPTEVLVAHNAGADFVKLFPVGNLGASYLKALCAPISHVRMLAVGGVDDTNIGQFLKAGACGAGVGGKLVRKEWVDAGQYDQITNAAKRLVDVVMEENL